METVNSLWNQAQQFAALGDADRAYATFARIIAVEPAHAESLLQLSYLESMRGRYRAAREFALRAAATRPRQLDTVVELLSRLRTFNEHDAFDACIARLPPLAHLPIPALLALGAQLSYFNDQSGALRFLDEAARGDPDFPPTLAARGHVLMYMGRLDQAFADLERCTRLAPALAQAWWLLSRIGVAEGRDRRIAELRRRLPSISKPDDRVLLLFALHNELDAMGLFDEAWASLDEACRIKRASIRYEPASTTALVDDLVALRLPRRAPPPDASGGPLFIVGMHRSGTSLLEDLLDRHPDVRGLGELYDFTHQMRLATDHHCRGPLDRTIVARSAGVDFAAIGRGYRANVAWRRGGARWYSDKLPSNVLNVGFIGAALPESVVLHTVRDPMETCFSALRELFSDACPYSYDQREVAHYHREYRRLIAHWQGTEAARIIDVHYDQLVGDTQTAMQAVLDAVGIPFDGAVVRPRTAERGIATASAVQVRGAIRAQARPKWESYAEWLEAMREALAGN